MRGELLWAFDREHLVAIRAYIAMTGDRNTIAARGSPWSTMMHKLPLKLVLERNRETALKVIDAMLAGERAVP